MFSAKITLQTKFCSFIPPTLPRPCFKILMLSNFLLECWDLAGGNLIPVLSVRAIPEAAVSWAQSGVSLIGRCNKDFIAAFASWEEETSGRDAK